MSCDRMIGPYPCCSVVEGDCLELMKALPLICECGADVSGEGGIFHAVGGHENRYAIDAVITDPPYGMDYDTNGNRFTRGGRNLPRVHGDDKPFDVTPWAAFPFVVLWGFNHYPERLHAGGSLVWIKRSSAAFGCFLSDAEVAWVKGIKGVYCYEDAVFPISAERQHPTEKPVGLMEWSILKSKAPEDTTILDPFCGSGTTLVAAKKLGRHFLGFEISHEYCEIARDRLARIEAQPTLFEPKPEQLELGQ